MCTRGPCMTPGESLCGPLESRSQPCAAPPRGCGRHNLGGHTCLPPQVERARFRRRPGQAQHSTVHVPMHWPCRASRRPQGPPTCSCLMPLWLRYSSSREVQHSIPSMDSSLHAGPMPGWGGGGGAAVVGVGFHEGQTAERAAAATAGGAWRGRGRQRASAASGWRRTSPTLASGRKQHRQPACGAFMLTAGCVCGWVVCVWGGGQVGAPRCSSCSHTSTCAPVALQRDALQAAERGQVLDLCEAVPPQPQLPQVGECFEALDLSHAGRQTHCRVGCRACQACAGCHSRRLNAVE